MKPLLLALLTAVLLSLAATACGDSGNGTHHQADVASTASSGTQTKSVPTGTPIQSSFRGDEDDDETRSNYTGSNRYDNDVDYDNDTHENTGYHDSDDSSAHAFGHAPSATDRRAIATLVKRYYADAATSDGAKACALIYSILAETIPEDYGRGAGPAYSRGKTCAVVMTKYFKHNHSQLAGAVKMTGVRVNGNEAHAFLGSKAMPASLMPVQREHGKWKIDALLGLPMP
jgi:hypothetical protein